jgi:hypothetical protein
VELDTKSLILAKTKQETKETCQSERSIWKGFPAYDGWKALKKDIENGG